MGERDSKGRFLSGHAASSKGRGGRPPRPVEDKYLGALQKCVKLGDWKAICQRAVTEARGGDYRARQWLSDYLLGKPIQELKVDARTDLDIILTWDDDNAEPDTSEAP